MIAPMFNQHGSQQVQTNPIGQPATLQKFLRIDQVSAFTGLSRSTIYAHMANRTFPNCIRLGPRAIAWRESDLVAWQASCQAKQAGV
jgi:prophage regulatory protein